MPDVSPEATQTETTQTVQTPAPEPTLEDVYKNAQPEPQPAKVEPAPQRQEPQTAAVPDPYDTDAHKAYLASLAQGQTQLREAVQAVTGYLTQQQAKEARAALEADIKSAVATVSETVDAKPKLIEAMLDAKAREEPRFKALWENRTKNPQAWNQALKAVSREFAEELTVKVDPKLVEAQRVRRASQKQTSATVEQDEPDSSWDGLDSEAFQRRWNEAIGG